MKLSKGYLPRITGRPSSQIAIAKVDSPLQIPLVVGGKGYSPQVSAGQSVQCGQALGRLEVSGGSLVIPAPYSGTVESVQDEQGFVLLKVSESEAKPWSKRTYPDPSVLDGGVAREQLAAAGIWPGLWDSTVGDTPALDAAQPKAVVVKAVITEPFRARGKVILENDLDSFLQGLAYLERLSGEFAPTYLILTAAQHPLAKKIKKAVAGLAWIRPVFVPLTYPSGNNQYLWWCLRRNDENLQQGDSVWMLDTQTVADISRCLGQGLVPSRRIVSLGGPGLANGQHYSVPIGTPLSALCGQLESFEGLRVLRGGMFTGRKVEPEQAAVGHLDDGFTFLPEGTDREFLSFIRPGCGKPSYSPGYLSFLRPNMAVDTSTALRGEPRACIACGYCEDVCPVKIMPHLIWRFLGKDMLEEAQMAGAEICVRCGLCSYVCPSKIELTETICKGIDQIQEELSVENETQEVSQ